jgi:uncharacterized protein (TIGR03437 family)
LEDFVKILNRKLFSAAALPALAMAISLSASSQVLNLSKDLVSLGIATQNMMPDMCALDSRPLFQAGIEYASAHGIPTVVAERGRYYFLSLNSSYQHVYLNEISNVTVDLNYSDLYFAFSNIVAIQVANSTNLTLKNFTVDYQVLPFTQVTVTGVSGTTVNVTQMGSYPLPSSFNTRTVPSNYIISGYYAFIFRNGQELRATGRMQVVPPPFSDTSIQLMGSEPWATVTDIANIQPGDALVLEWRAGVATIYAGLNTNLTVQNISIYASGYLGVGVGNSSNTTIDHVQVIPRPGTNRLISTNADGIHLSHAGANNMVTNNTVRRGCDDGIAIDGQWAASVNGPATGNTVQVTPNGTSMSVGESIQFISIVDATIVDTATITAMTTLTGGAILLTVDHAVSGLQTGFGVTPADASLRGGGSVISGNLVSEEVFGRGIYPAGVENVTVTDNLTQMTNQSGILVEQTEGLSYSYKTGPNSGISITNNVVDSALCYGTPSNPITGLTGSINMDAFDEHFNWVTTESFSDFTITGNFVTNSPHSGIRVENVNGGTVTGNLIAVAGTQPDDYIWYLPAGETMAHVETEDAMPIVAVNTSVSVAGNETTAPAVTNRSLADGGFRSAPQSIVVARGENFTTKTASAEGKAHTLGGIQVNVKDSAGVSRTAGLYYSSPSQVTYVMPDGTAPGVATVTVGTQASGALVSTVAPGLFSADGTGTGVALATAQLDTTGGKQKSETVYQCATSCVAQPLDLGKRGDVLYVFFEGTGIRGRSSLKDVVAEVGGIPVRVKAATKLPDSDPGNDYVSVIIPHSLKGAGEVPVVITVDGFTANVVTINIK